MELQTIVHRWIIVAEKLLFHNHIAGCFEVCNELEDQMEEIIAEGNPAKEMEQNIERIKSIKRKLNAIMIQNFPKRTIR
jgi:hypothetical protein